MARALLAWTALCLAIAVPLTIAAMSPLLQWRQPTYVAAGFAGILGLGLLLVQPLLAGNRLPGLTARRARQAHRLVGIALVAAVLLHVVGLWITSPPDVVDVLLFRSPTPFSVWGALAMWATFAAALVAAGRTRLRLGFRAWRTLHAGLATVVVGGTVIHALLIEGAMEPVSKAILCALVIAATARLLLDLRPARTKSFR